MKNRKITASLSVLGCFKNTVDSEVLGGILEKKNIEIVSPYENADWLIINTCGFIQEAKEESLDEIFDALERKEKGEIKHIAVFGCLVQRYLKELTAEFKNIDVLWGVNDLDELAETIANNTPKSYQDKKLFLYNENYKRIITTTPNTTFIKISEGCNMKCSFCAIPQIRGPYRSRDINSIIEEAAGYKEMGFQEIVLISQNSTYFGKDKGEKSLLPQLLEEIAKLDFPWVRVLYLMPEEVSDEIIDAFSRPSIIPYFDLPFQHVSQQILQQMKRGGGFEKSMELIKKIRDKYKEAVIRSSFIVGFPGEGTKDFAELLDFARQSEMERIGVFRFSGEDGTAAAGFRQQVAPRVMNRRVRQLMDVSDRNIELYNKKLIGSVQEFIPLGPWQGAAAIGRIKSQSPDTDGLTCVEEVFTDDYRIYKIRITGFQNELLRGEKI